jgi:hypothetical protein
MRLGTNHFHSDGGMGWDFIVSEIFFPQAVQEVEYLFSNFTFQYNGNSVETFFFLAIVRAKK